jgi:xylose isomerase
MDTFARGLLVADALIRDGVFSRVLADRYRGFRETEMGRKILARATTLPELEAWAESVGEPERVSGRQEALENVLNDYLYRDLTR